MRYPAAHYDVLKLLICQQPGPLLAKALDIGHLLIFEPGGHIVQLVRIISHFHYRKFSAQPPKLRLDWRKV